MKNIGKKIDTIIMKAVQMTKSERGASEVLVGIIFTAIVVLAVITLNPTISSALTDAGTAFKTWLAAKIAAILT